MNRTRYAVTMAAFLILCAGSVFAQATGDQVAKGPAPKAASSAPKTTKAPLIDLNTATKKELMTLPGISDAIAQKIIANRKYNSKTDLTQKKVISADLYAKISSKIVTKTTTRVSPGNVEKKAASSKDATELKKQ